MKKLKTIWRQNWQLYVIIAIPLIFLLIFMYYPMYGVTLAFKNFISTKGITGSPWVGLRHFERFFSAPSTPQIILNTIKISLYSLVASIPAPVILAICLNECRKKFFKKMVQLTTYIPYFISTVVMVGLLNQWLDPRFGVVNVLLQQFGFDTINFMSNPAWFTHIYVWSGVWQATGFSAVIYIATLSSIDQQLHEAAIVDGASRLRRIISIDIPGIMPVFTILLILSMGNIMAVGFEKIYLMQNTLNTSVSEVISTYVYKIGLVNSDFAFGTAVGLFNSIINLILLVLVNWVCKKVGETSLW